VEWHIYLLGYPLGHTLSPELHNRYFRQLQLPLTYQARPIPPSRFHNEVPQLMQEEGFLGANVTVPYKAEIVPLLDEVRGEASAIGAVNTVVRTSAGLVGYNTDAPALEETLRAAGWTRVNSAMIAGSGGGAQAALWALAQMGCSKFVILYRSERRLRAIRDLLGRLDKRPSFIPMRRVQEFFCWAEREGHLLRQSAADAAALLDSIARESTGSVSAAANALTPESESKQFDLLVNATPVGLHPHADEAIVDHPCFFRLFRAVADLVYNPQQTKLLFLSHLAGCQTISGMRMLEAQAVRSRALWLAQLSR